jgi:hypothetical protein
LSAFAHLIEGIASVFVPHFKENLLVHLFKIGEDNVKKLK